MDWARSTRNPDVQSAVEAEQLGDRPHLDYPAIGADNERMDVPGRIENGVVVLEAGTKLPEGAQVVVSLRTMPPVRVAPTRHPVRLPIFDYDGPPDIDLTNDQIGEILTREDASA